MDRSAEVASSRTKVGIEMAKTREIKIGHEREFLLLSDLYEGESTRSSKGELWSVHVHIALSNLRADARVWLNDVLDPPLAGFFHDLAESWRGWDGVREWRAYEDGLALCAPMMVSATSRRQWSSARFRPLAGSSKDTYRSTRANSSRLRTSLTDSCRRCSREKHAKVAPRIHDQLIRPVSDTAVPPVLAVHVLSRRVRSLACSSCGSVISVFDPKARCGNIGTHSARTPLDRNRCLTPFVDHRWDS